VQLARQVLKAPQVLTGQLARQVLLVQLAQRA
jgi:hypothetical protein